MADPYAPPKAGFPIRRLGKCRSDETSCGATWGGFSACCPGESTCPGLYETITNNVCCPGRSDCTAPLEKEPHCANTTNFMYNRGYFCCEPGQFAFFNKEDFVGCVDEFPNNRNYTILDALPQTLASTTIPATGIPKPTTSLSSSTSSSNAASNTASASAKPTETGDSSSSKSKTNVGAIAGGVVGGVAGLVIIVGLIFFFMRRNRKYSRAPVEVEASELKGGHAGDGAYIQHQSSPFHGSVPNSSPSPGSVPHTSPSPGIYSASHSASPHPPPTGNSPMSELANNQRPVELES